MGNCFKRVVEVILTSLTYVYLPSIWARGMGLIIIGKCM